MKRTRMSGTPRRQLGPLNDEQLGEVVGHMHMNAHAHVACTRHCALLPRSRSLPYADGQPIRIPHRCRHFPSTRARTVSAPVQLRFLTSQHSGGGVR